MITKRSEALDLIEQYRKLIEPIKEKPARLTFGSHNLAIIVQGIELQKTTGFKNAPAKQTDVDGKKRTPMLFSIKTYDGDLVFLLDKTKVAAIHDGIRFSTGDYNVDLRLDHEPNSD